ncbi:MAG: SprT-like domain-containing protein [Trueperaceae bacterium]
MDRFPSSPGTLPQIPPAGLLRPGVRTFALHERSQGRIWLVRPRPTGPAFAAWELHAAEVMLAHGLHDWAFGFGRGKRTLGTTRVRAGARHGTVRLSRHLIEAVGLDAPGRRTAATETEDVPADGPMRAPTGEGTGAVTDAVTDAVIEDTLLHEVAHAVAFLRHGRAAMNHGPLWRRVAREVGAAPRATCAAGPIAPAPWIMICQRCNHEVPLYRRPKHPPSAYRHKGCGGAMRLQPGPSRFASSRARRDARSS